MLISILNREQLRYYKGPLFVLMQRVAGQFKTESSHHQNILLVSGLPIMVVWGSGHHVGSSGNA